MKVYHFERISRERIHAESEEDGRNQLEALGYIAAEFELADITEVE